MGVVETDDCQFEIERKLCVQNLNYRLRINEIEGAQTALQERRAKSEL
jgi:hypothetical protein